MIRTIVAVALAAAVPAQLLTDYTVCNVVHNGPIQSQKPQIPFTRQPDAAASTLYPKTLIFDGMPPERMRGPATVTVSTGSIVDCGRASIGVFEACTRGNIIHTDNPCDHPDQSYARLLCHEIAHESFGWPADHGA